MTAGGAAGVCGGLTRSRDCVRALLPASLILPCLLALVKGFGLLQFHHGSSGFCSLQLTDGDLLDFMSWWVGVFHYCWKILSHRLFRYWLCPSSLSVISCRSFDGVFTQYSHRLPRPLASLPH